jgi:TfoX/Sxy family transcriptional regulator of competence genes
MSLNDHLLEQFENNVRGLAGVTRKKMFGCEAFFRDGTIFGLIWKEGRIGLKFPGTAYDVASQLKGSDPWSPGGEMTMKRWVLLPESLHDDDDGLKTWIRRAHEEAPAKAAPAKKKASPAKKTSKPAPKKKKK